MRDDWVVYAHLLTKTLVEMRRRQNGLDTENDDFAGLFDLALKLGIMRQISPDTWTAPIAAVVVFFAPYLAHLI